MRFVHNMAINLLYIKNKTTNDSENKFKYRSLVLDDFLVSREEYVNISISSAFVTYNVIIATDEKNEWIGGDMGWFGMGTKPDNWNEAFHTILKEHQDYYITIVDCHC